MTRARLAGKSADNDATRRQRVRARFCAFTSLVNGSACDLPSTGGDTNAAVTASFRAFYRHLTARAGQMSSARARARTIAHAAAHAATRAHPAHLLLPSSFSSPSLSCSRVPARIFFFTVGGCVTRRAPRTASLYAYAHCRQINIFVIFR